MENIIKINTIGDLKTVLYKNTDKRMSVYFYNKKFVYFDIIMKYIIKSISFENGNTNIITCYENLNGGRVDIFDYDPKYIIDNFIGIPDSSNVLLDGNKIIIEYIYSSSI